MYALLHLAVSFVHDQMSCRMSVFALAIHMALLSVRFLSICMLQIFYMLKQCAVALVAGREE